jgi:5-methylcytosine-specific restriction protein B
LIFEQRAGIFKRLCDVAGNNLDQHFYLIIDEINRGDIPRIFGELLTVLEKDKRGQAILLPLSGESFSPLGAWLRALNQRILEHVGRDARNLQIGHAYLLDKDRPVSDLARFARILQDDILPLLQEYCYEDYATLARILGPGLVDEAQQRIRHELFEPAQRDDLVQVLLTPDIAASLEAVTLEEEQLEELDADGMDGDSADGERVAEAV